MMGADITRPLVVLAPGIHVGGGLVLLQAFLTSSSANVRWLLIDERARGKLEPQGNAVVHYVKRSVFSRLSAEWRLRKGAKETDVVLCFHGLPPLFSLPGRVVVFLQNRILVNDQALSDYPPFTRARLRFERLMLRVFSHHVDRFIVQTPSMASDVARKLGKRPEVSEVAFAAELHTGSGSLPDRYDFVYVAGDDVHKNHAVLLDAWRLLAIDGLRPTLALTLPRASTLASAVEQLRQDGLSHITNLGVLSHQEVSRLYGACSALIFPSYTESLGLPLIEAAQHGLPVLAPELDYVRDVVGPAQTFDPHSPLSLARAVKRFLGRPDATVSLRSPEEFLLEVLK